MPEGDTLHRTARAIAPDLEGQTPTRIWLREVGEVARTLLGPVHAVEAVGKHLVIRLGEGWLLRTHLGMRGAWHRYRPGEAWQRPRSTAAVVVETPGWVFVCFRAAEVELVQRRADPRKALPALSRLGPDLLGEALDLDEVVRRFRRFAPPPRPVAEALLDQRIAAGVGNVYKSELLFLRRLDPRTPAADVPDLEVDALYGLAREWLQHNLHTRRRETRTQGPSRLWVYGRTQRPCLRCGAAIQRIRQGDHDRSTWYCPVCQR